MTKEQKREYNRQYIAKHHDKILHDHKTKYAGIYASWYSMKGRCNNRNFKQWKDYGGRGIKYDPRWEQFENFERDMHEGYAKGLTLERIDTNGNYCKENCRWATRQEQNRNKRCNVLIEYAGEKKRLVEWAKTLGINYGTLRARFYNGMKPEDILNPTLFRPWKLNE